jgi:hypothetical protein
VKPAITILVSLDHLSPYRPMFSGWCGLSSCLEVLMSQPARRRFRAPGPDRAPAVCLTVHSPAAADELYPRNRPAAERLDQLIDDTFTNPASLTAAFGGSGGTR